MNVFDLASYLIVGMMVIAFLILVLGALAVIGCEIYFMFKLIRHNDSSSDKHNETN